MWQKMFFFLATMMVAGCSQEAIDKILNPPFLTGYGQDVGDNDSTSNAADNVSGTLDTTTVDNDSGGVTDDVPVVCPDPPPPFADGKRVPCFNGDPVFYCTTILDPSNCYWKCLTDDGGYAWGGTTTADELPIACKVGTP